MDDQNYLGFTPKRRSILWNYNQDNNIRVFSISKARWRSLENKFGVDVNNAFYPEKDKKDYTITKNENCKNQQDEGELIIFNKAGSLIWEMCDGSTTVEEMIGTFLDKYDITKTELIEDMKIFFNICIEKNIIDLDWRAIL